MSNILISLAAEFVGKKAFDQAGKSTVSLERQVKKLASTLGLTFSTAAVIAYGKTSVKAFAEMEAQQQRLSSLLKVGTGATLGQVQSLNNQAAALENLGVVSKGNITQTQSQLATFNLQAATIEKLTPAILDYVTAEKGAAASTDQFKQMTNGLAQALNGNFASLTKTGFVIDENTKKIIKNGNESERAEAIVSVLDSTYKGFNKSLRDTPIGQMQLLTNAADDLSEAIGQSLVSAFAAASGEAGVEGFVSRVNILSNKIRNFSDEILLFGVKARAAFSFEGLLKGQNFIDKAVDEARRKLQYKDAQGFEIGNNSVTGFAKSDEVARKRAKKLEAERLKLLASQNKIQKALTAEQKKQALAKKQSALFDLDQIGLLAALKGNLSEQDRLRVKLQLALLTENTSEADKLSQRLAMSIDSTGDLALYLRNLPDAKNPFLGWDEWLKSFTKNLASVTGSPIPTTNGAITPSAPIPSTNASPVTGVNRVPTSKELGDYLGSGRSTNDLYAGPPIIIQIDGKEIASAVQNQSLQGNDPLVNRLLGGFR